MALSISCTCCALVSASAGCCGYLCYPSAVKRQWPFWSNPVPLSLIQCTHVVHLFLRRYVVYHMVLIALECGKVLRLPLRSYRLYNRISHFQFDTNRCCNIRQDHPSNQHLAVRTSGSTVIHRPALRRTHGLICIYQLRSQCQSLRMLREKG